jgi:nitroimidazol reductase NimA-like FMN-containing flavoprotein (pyridoxamine 5'-phosphate oxidase superfamily)
METGVTETPVTGSPGTDTLTRARRTTVNRLPARGNYDREVVKAILSEGLVCHVGFVWEGSPFVIPTGYGSDGDFFYIHGSSASRMVRTLSAGAEACITVTLQDGLVLARSAFHHSMNYRSVVLFGKARLVDQPEEKLDVLRKITEHLVPGRWADVRLPTPLEMKATAVLAFPLDEASAKIRVGPPSDDEEDYALPIWAGVLPLALQPGVLQPDERNLPGVGTPEYVLRYSRIRASISR